MYQFYYAKEKKIKDSDWANKLVQKIYEPEATRAAMWEEHCLECAAPLCFGECPHYEARIDGRCKRMENGIEIRRISDANGGYSAHVKFRKWGNVMSIIYPALLRPEQMQRLQRMQMRQGKIIRFVLGLKLPVSVRWTFTRCAEYAFRYYLKKSRSAETEPDAFYLHAASYETEPFALIMEIFQEEKGVFRQSFRLRPGENAYLIRKEELSPECFKPGNLIKIYPEDNREAEVEFFWCDFVKGKPITLEKDGKPADKVKCVVWDLDNTLWSGTLIETEDSGRLSLRQGVWETIQKLDEKGIIQSIASKNDYSAAWPVIERLGLNDYFLYPQIHWNAKSGSLEEIARKLNIGIDSLALIDDSVFEREQVRSVLPQVRIYDADELEKIFGYPEFQGVVTEESRKRRALYRAEEKRKEFQRVQNSETLNFIKKCNLKITLFTPEKEQEKLRCYELVVRTNQLNMSGKKYTAEEFQEVLKKQGHKNFAFSCRDDFGEYGIVGFGQYRVNENNLIFTEFAMSCRVAGKYVESALFHALLSLENCEKGQFEVIKTKKNELLRRSLEEIGFQSLGESGEKIQYIFGANLLNDDVVKVIRGNHGDR